MQTVVGLFHDAPAADAAILALTRAGFPRGEINVMIRPGSPPPGDISEDSASAARREASTGRSLRGGVLVALSVMELRAAEAAALLLEGGALDESTSRREWLAGGWVDHTSAQRPEVYTRR